MQIYLAVTPEETQQAREHCRNLAHVAYRIGPGSALLRQSLLLQTKGGLLSVSDRQAPFIDSPEDLRDAVLRECGRRGYSGVLLDFEEAPRRDRTAFVSALAPALSSSRRALFLPEGYAGAAPGAGRLALDVQRLRMDFRLPARSGEGEPLTGEALAALMERENPAVFFSQDLCARYFTYNREGEAHFVLFDDADTLNQKLRLGVGMGFQAAFLMWPEVQDIAPRLFAPWRGGKKPP